jgi:hypothetical protein
VVRCDPLTNFFSHFFEVQKLIDVEPVKIVPTWKNARRGREGISKRIDKFLIAKKFDGRKCHDKILC